MLLKLIFKSFNEEYSEIVQYLSIKKWQYIMRQNKMFDWKLLIHLKFYLSTQKFGRLFLNAHTHIVSTVHSQARLYTHPIHCTLTLSTIHSHSRLCTRTLDCTLTISTVHSQARLYTHTLYCTLTLSTVQSHSRLYTHTLDCTLTLSNVHSHSRLCTHSINCTTKNAISPVLKQYLS